MVSLYYFLFTSVLIPSIKCEAGSKSKEFPKGFIFGASTAAYQVEGATHEDGKGENIWDRYIKLHPERFAERENADVACDSYHKYKEDVQMLKEVGFSHYRFSISWSRIMPNGHENFINKKGLQYYHNLIDDLLANGIEPFVTIYHFDLPQPLQDLGGWPNPVIAEYFERYAKVLFQEFGHKVKWWTTINEPMQITYMGYGGNTPPGVNQTGIADFLATRTLLLAHARVYRLYQKNFAATQKGKVGITFFSIYFKPKTNSLADIHAAERATQFLLGLYAHPIFSEKGDYPDLVKHVVDNLSQQEGWFSSRLPQLSASEIEMIKGSADFIGLNHYTSRLTGECPSKLCKEEADFVNPEAKVVLSTDPDWPTAASPWLQSYPDGVRKVLNWIKNEYNNPPVIITEAGWSTEGKHVNINDQSRIQYYQDYMDNILDAMIEDKCNVFGLIAWSLMDNFEWVSGYTQRFGLYYVDFNDPNRPRTKRKSADFFKDVITTRKLPKIKANSKKNT